MFVNEKLRCYVDCRYIYITYICIHNVVIYYIYIVMTIVQLTLMVVNWH